MPDLQKALEEAEQELSVVSDGQSVASEQSSRLSERLTALRMEAAKLEAERATAKSSAEQLRGLEHAMRGDREQKLQLIDRYTQEAAELEKTLQAEQDKLAGQDAAAQARQEELQAALTERAKVEARKNGHRKGSTGENRDILNMERESAVWSRAKMPPSWRKSKFSTGCGIPMS